MALARLLVASGAAIAVTETEHCQQGSISMLESGKAVEEALAIEGESNDEVEAARVEQQRGQSSLSLGLLVEAIEKERASLDLLDQGVETLRQAVEDRRKALDQQQEILQELVGEMRTRES
jgi:hypothetical protein